MDFSSKEDAGIDRISGLPDHILSHILSFLPTKHAVGTSILSKRWIHLWASVPILDFDARLHKGFHSLIHMNEFPESEFTFWDFVNRVMLLSGISHIQKFRLIYECHYSAAPICTWLNAAISRGISELELDFFLSIRKEVLRLPRMFFMSNTLVVLKLSRMPLIVPSVVSFPKLKVLEIRMVVYLDDTSTQILLSGCRVLEELVIEETTRERPRVIDISIHTLKRFCFSYRFVIDISTDFPYKFIINAPNLENFYVKGRISDDFVVKSLGALVNAHLDLRQTAVLPDNYSLCQERVLNLLNGIANVKFLSLSSDIVQLLRKVHDLKLPSFFNLTTVGLGFGFDICLKRLAAEFIKRSPNMEVLVINNKQGLFGDIVEWSMSPPQPIPEHLYVRLKDALIQELYSTFLPEAVEYLVQEVNVLKRLNVTCLCPVRLSSQIGDSF